MPGKLGRGRIAGALFGWFVAACSPLGAFNTVIPMDGGVSRVVRDAEFGADPRQRIDVYRPRGEAPDRPVIVFIYGGSWNSGSKDGYSFVARALAARGFVVAVPDYRLVPAVRFPAFIEDNAAAIRWIRAHAAEFGGDPARIVLVGHSAGAYNVSMLALDPKWLGADRAAIRGWVGLAGPYDFLPLTGPVTPVTFGSEPDLKQTQPITFAGAGDPPAMLATGDKDHIVLPRNSDALDGRLSAAGVAVTRLRYPRVGHAGLIIAFAKPLRDRASVLDDTAAFASRVTGR